MDRYTQFVRRYILQGNLRYSLSDNDVSASLQTQIADRDEYYTELLENHVKITKVRGICKEIHKWTLFWLITVACILGIYYITRILEKILVVDNIELVIDAIPVLITDIVSLVATVIAIPNIIARFLFNTKEDDNITNLITHTQDHDSAGISIFKDRFLKQNGGHTPPNQGAVDSDSA